MNTSQDIKMQMVDDNVGNQERQNVVQYDGNEVCSRMPNHYGNGNVVTAPAEGNGNGINGNPIRCYNYRGEGHYASNCTVKSRKRDAAYLQQQITLQKILILELSLDTAPVYDRGSTEVPNDENCYDHDIFNMHTHEVQYTDLQTELDRTKEKLENCIIKKEKEYAVLVYIGTQNVKECKYDKISYDKAYNDMQQKIERLQAQLGDLKGKSCDTQCASNTLDPLFQKLEDEKVSLESQVTSIGTFPYRGIKRVCKLLRYDSHDVDGRVGKSIRSLLDELFNGENQVVSKPSDVTTADAFDKRQQQQDSTSSTSSLATTISADGNFDL
ncbi:gag-pol polyprotein [Tanacetum coccineum]